MPQIGQRPHNPIIAPGPILLGHANNQPLNCLVDPRLAWASMLRAIELAGDEPSVPCQDGVRQGGSRHLAECLATQSTANLAQLRSLCVRELQPPLQLAPQNPVFSSQILIPQQQLLVHRPRNVGQDTCPLHESPPICPPIREGALNRPKKPSGRHAARLRRDGITARLSCSFNFLATREELETGPAARSGTAPVPYPTVGVSRYEGPALWHGDGFDTRQLSGKTGSALAAECFCHRFAHIAWSRGRGSWLRPPSQIQHLKKAHSFAVSSGSHALRTYTDDAGVPLAAAGRTLRGHAARTACVCRCLWGHLKMRGFLRASATVFPCSERVSYI